MNIDQIISGFKTFHQEYYINQPGFYKSLVEKGQNPEVMVIACSDSRVNPSLIANAEPGDIFVVRNVANLVPPYDPNTNYLGTSACIEFAVQDLGVRHIIVLGHSHCGGIKRLCEGVEDAEGREFIDGWVSIAKLAFDPNIKGDKQHRKAEREAIGVSLNNLLTFPWIKTKIEQGQLELHGWYFDLDSGKIFSKMVNEEWLEISRDDQSRC